jgi:hypothetical protein
VLFTARLRCLKDSNNVEHLVHCSTKLFLSKRAVFHTSQSSRRSNSTCHLCFWQILHGERLRI